MRCMDCLLPIDPWEYPTQAGDVITHHDCDLDAVVAAREAWIEAEVDRIREERI
jgi:hypothetical protein